MANMKKINLAGKDLGTVEVDEDFVKATANSQMVKDYIVALRNNARQWSASTKTRAEVAHTTKKPHPQKGQGRARQGSLVSPQYRGGGRVFTPRPKFDQHVSINRKERKAAVRALLAQKLRDNKVIIVDHFDLKAPKTKTIADFIKKQELKGRILFLGEGKYEDKKTDEGKVRISAPTEKKHHNFSKSINNLQKTAFTLAANVNGYDLMLAQHVVMTQSAFDELHKLLK